MMIDGRADGPRTRTEPPFRNGLYSGEPHTRAMTRRKEPFGLPSHLPLDQYPEEWVAVLGPEVVEHDPVLARALERFRSEYPDAEPLVLKGTTPLSTARPRVALGH